MARLTYSLLVLAFAAGGQAGGIAYLCQMSGEVGESCCCAGDEAEESTGAAAIDVPDQCCEVLASAAADFPTGVAPEAPTPRLPAAGWVETAELLPPPDPDVDQVELSARAPPQRSRLSLQIWHCTFLV